MTTKHFTIILALTVTPVSSTLAQIGEFVTYQGSLASGTSPATGLFDLKFTICDSLAGGTTVSGPTTNSAVAITNGLFTTAIPVTGSGAIFYGSDRWLEIAVRTNGGGAFVALTPRQRFSPTPYAFYAVKAGTADSLVNGVYTTGTYANPAWITGLAGNKITGDVAGNAAGFNGSLAGDVAGMQSATVVSGVGGQTAANVANGASAANAATSAAAANTIVKRDATASFSVTDLTLNGDLNLPATTASAGIIYSGGSPLIHSYGFVSFFAGTGAGNLTMSGPGGNTGVGASALRNNTSGYVNTANGYGALYANTIGSWNTAIGEAALGQNTNGSGNTAIGASAMGLNTSGSNNIALGYQAGYNITTGSGNIDIGNAGGFNDTNIIRIGSGQTQTYIAGVINGNGNGLTNLNAAKLTGTFTGNVIGSASAATNLSGSLAGDVTGTQSTTVVSSVGGQPAANVAGGASAANAATSANTPGTIVKRDGSGNFAAGTATFNGSLYLPATTASAGIIYSGGNRFIHAYGFQNFFAGAGAGRLTTTGNGGNTGVGYQVLENITDGYNNSGFGFQALRNNAGGFGNAALGAGALYRNTSGSNNTANGNSALYWNATGSFNTAVGLQALALNGSGSNNIALGCLAGYNIYGNDNIDIGNQGFDSDNNVIRIGSDQTSVFIAGVVTFTNGSMAMGNCTNNAANAVALGYRTSVGAQYATIGGGTGNSIQTNASYSFLGGGVGNTISGAGGFVGGGGYDGSSVNGNTASGAGSVVVGGTQNIASGSRSTVGGGHNNSATNFYATVPGGAWNLAGGQGSFAAGRAAKALHDGSFVWNDAASGDLISTNANSVSMRASGGYRLFSSGNAGVYLVAGGGSWTSLSDRNAKENFSAVDAQEVLAKVTALPLTTWNYKSQAAAVRHIGPMAQDFKAAFAVGESETGITTIDADGVALAAIQGLNQKLEEKGAEIQALKRQNESLVERLNSLEQMVKSAATRN
jgi:hypothetical protein